MDFSFGIITGGEEEHQRSADSNTPVHDRILEVVESIHKERIPNYEIIIVGGDSNIFFAEDSKYLKSHEGCNFSFRHIPFQESLEPSGWISKKKNIITSLAIFDDVVYMHDYHVLQEGWYKSFLDFGSDWDICMNSILTIKGERFRDWITWDDPELGRQAELDYDDDSKVQNQYISGGYWVAKRRVMLFNPLDEKYNRNTQHEDVDWSLRVRDKYRYRMNKNSVVKHNKTHWETDTRGYFTALEKKKESKENIKNCWILTFDRPKALNRQIKTFGEYGFKVNIFSNHPEVDIEEDNKKYVDQIIINNLSDPKATSYCARSWNNMFIKCFIDKEVDGSVFVQDDTHVHHPDFGKYLVYKAEDYDFIWGPLGDTFFFLKRSVLRKVGWFDERYLGCYCADADFLKRVYFNYDKNKISIQEIHDWGFEHNSIKISEYIDWSMASRGVDESYKNQHDQLQNDCGQDKVVSYSQGHFKSKWQTPGNGLNSIGSVIDYEPPEGVLEVDWYPWFSKII